MHSGSGQDFGWGRTDLPVDSTGELQWPLLVASLPGGTGVNHCPVLGYTPDLSHKHALTLFRAYGGICSRAAGLSPVTNEGVEVTFPEWQLLSPPLIPLPGTA